MVYPHPVAGFPGAQNCLPWCGPGGRRPERNLQAEANSELGRLDLAWHLDGKLGCNFRTVEVSSGSSRNRKPQLAVRALGAEAVRQLKPLTGPA